MLKSLNGPRACFCPVLSVTWWWEGMRWDALHEPLGDFRDISNSEAHSSAQVNMLNLLKMLSKSDLASFEN